MVCLPHEPMRTWTLVVPEIMDLVLKKALVVAVTARIIRLLLIVTSHSLLKMNSLPSMVRMTSAAAELMMVTEVSLIITLFPKVSSLLMRAVSAFVPWMIFLFLKFWTVR